MTNSLLLVFSCDKILLGDKMKEKIKDLFGNSKEVFKEYKFTFILIFITTISMLFLYDDSDYYELITALVLSGVLFFMVETFIKNENKKGLPLIGSVVVSVLLNHVLYETDNTPRIPLLIAGIYISVFIITIYKISKKHKNFSEYFLKVSSNNIIFSIASFILQLGLLFISFAITTLLITDSSYEIFARTEIIFLGLFVAPGEILCLTNTKGEPLKLLKFLIYYILLPIVLISMLIIYIYFVKIIVTNTIPSNQIFTIITILFVITVPTYILIMNYDDNKFIKRIINQLPYTFLPLIAMAMYSLGVRIYHYGITIPRYYGIMIIALELYFFILSLKKNHKYMRSILLFGTVLTLISMTIPYINCVSISRYSQLRRLTSIYKEDTIYENLSYEEKDIIYESYAYIKYDLDSEKYIPDYIDTSKIKYNYVDYTKKDEKNISYYGNDKEISIKGFSSFKEISIDEYDRNISNMNLDDIELYKDKDQNKVLKENFKNELEAIIEDGDVTNPRIKLDDKYEIYINSFSMSYDVETNKVDYLNLNGYLLTK